MSLAISVERLSKHYRLGTVSSGTLRGDFSRWWARARRQPDPLEKVGQKRHARQEGDIFKALADVSFEVKEGEVFGIIGRNGAGKSTLLKILSQVTAPTGGRVEVRGRIASLLEVGTGFHPELTGRENIFLNGAILGMTKPEIRRKFDEIVAFSGVEEFIDTPAKRYSSGMYVRLAFAVAAHLEPDILLLDEVLAVGDASFQSKCIGKIGDVAGGGRTVLVVSHNMTVVSSLCTRALLLDAGRVSMEGDVEGVLAGYLDPGGDSQGEVSWTPEDPAANGGRLRLAGARVVFRGRVSPDVEIDEPFALEFDFEVLRPGLKVSSSIHVLDKHGACAFVSVSRTRQLKPGMFRHSYLFPPNLMNDGGYSISIFLLTDTDRPEVVVGNAVHFRVHETSGRQEYLGAMIGVLRPRLDVSETELP